MRYYFIGIAGTAMASVAALLKQKGHDVWGSDRGIYPPMSDFLAANQIPVWEGSSESHLETPFDVAVIGNVFTRGHIEIEAILNRHLPFTSLPELIHSEFIRHYHNIVITGTHGKTTTTALLSWILEVGGLSPTFMIGGISRNFDSSIQLGKSKYFVIEGDEYDCAFFDKRPKFLHYFPDHLIINNIEFDHADIYPDLAAIKTEFRKLLKLVPGNGLVVANAANEGVRSVIQSCYSRLQTFSNVPDQDRSYRILGYEQGQTVFEILEKGNRVGEFLFPFPGEYQLQNVLASVAVARDLEISWAHIREALSTFKGVKRRLEYWGEFHGASIYDDFAHHPTAIKVTLQALKARFPQRRLVALFEPRTNTITQNFFQENLANAFDAAEMVILTPLHRADALAAEKRLSLPDLTAALQQQSKTVHHIDDYSMIPELLKKYLHPDDVLVLLTNGNLGGQYAHIRSLICHSQAS